LPKGKDEVSSINLFVQSNPYYYTMVCRASE